MANIILTDPKHAHIKISIDENDYTNLARYRGLGYFDADEQTVEANHEDEIIVDEDKKKLGDLKVKIDVDADELAELLAKETVETKDDAETVADDEEKPKPRRKRRTVEK